MFLFLCVSFLHTTVGQFLSPIWKICKLSNQTQRSTKASSTRIMFGALRKAEEFEDVGDLPKTGCLVDNLAKNV